MSPPLTDAERIQVLVVHARDRLCAIRLAHIAETMRPLPISTVVGAPPYVLGVSMIRGVATPVVDLGAVLGETSPAALTRVFTVKSGSRRLAIAVERLVGVQLLKPLSLRPLPTSLQRGSDDKIEAVGSLDEQLLFLVEPLRLVPEALWASLTDEAA